MLALQLVVIMCCLLGHHASQVDVNAAAMHAVILREASRNLELAKKRWGELPHYDSAMSFVVTKQAIRHVLIMGLKETKSLHDHGVIDDQEYTLIEEAFSAARRRLHFESINVSHSHLYGLSLLLSHTHRLSLPRNGSVD